MRVLMVGDNRVRANWGGRATSIALLNLLSRCYKLGESLDASWVSNPIPIKTAFHPKIHSGLARHQNPLLRGFERGVSKIYGTRLDYVHESPSVTVDTILREAQNEGPFRRLVELIESHEVIVVNGEGDMIFSTPPRRSLGFRLATLELGRRLGKRTFYVNSMVSDCPKTGCNKRTLKFSLETLEKCDGVTVRDLESFEYLRREGISTPLKFVPDALFSWRALFRDPAFRPSPNGDLTVPWPERMGNFGRLKFDVPYICVGGSSLAVKDPDTMKDVYLSLVTDLKEIGLPIYLVETSGVESFFSDIADQADVGLVSQATPIMTGAAILANAKVFVSGRFHPSIMASLGGTPCVFLGSNSHKTRSLQRILEYDKIEEYSAFPSAGERRQIVERTHDLLQNNDGYRSKIIKTVDALAQDSESLLDFLKTPERA